MALELNGTTGVSLVQDGVITDANLPAGSVLQVVQQPLFSGSSTASTSYVSSGHNVQITPSSTSSKILITVAGGGGWPADGTNQGGGNKIYRSIGGGSASALTSQRSDWNIYSGNSTIIVPHSFSFLDAPNTTSQIQYAVFIRTDPDGAAGTYHYSVPYFASNATDYPYVTLTVMEIAGP